MANYTSSNEPIGGELEESVLRRQCRQGNEKLRKALVDSGYVANHAPRREIIEETRDDKVIFQLRQKIIALEKKIFRLEKCSLRDKTRKLVCNDIIHEICLYYSLSKEELLSRRRDLAVVRPRQVCMFLCKELTRNSLPEIGRRVGGVDHTTVLHGVRAIKLLIKKSQEIANDVVTLRARLE